MEEKKIQAVRDILINSDGRVGYAYLYTKDSGEKAGYVFDMTPENIANFIGSHQFDADKIIMTDMLDRLILETVGGFVANCPDQELCRKVLSLLLPLQTGEQEPREIPMVDKDTYEAYERWEDRGVTAAELGMLL